MKKFTAVLLLLLLIIGEVKCLLKLIDCDFEPSYKAEIVYGVSLATGTGGIIGWFDFGK